MYWKEIHFQYSVWIYAHKQETKCRVKCDKEQWDDFRYTLQECINLLDSDVNGLVSIYTRIKVQNSNVYAMLGEQ